MTKCPNCKSENVISDGKGPQLCLDCRTEFRKIAGRTLVSHPLDEDEFKKKVKKLMKMLKDPKPVKCSDCGEKIPEKQVIRRIDRKEIYCKSCRERKYKETMNALEMSLKDRTL